MSGIWYSCMTTEWGDVHLAADDRGLVASSLFGAPRDDLHAKKKIDPDIRLVHDREYRRTGAYRSWLRGYLNREVDCCCLPLFPRGTAFQQAVWEQMLQVPFGETLSYGEIAARLGKPGAARAVGSAAAANPIPIFIPCHRVVRADGTPGGFGGGTRLKQRMLLHESSS